METPDHSEAETPEQRREYWRGRGISLEHHLGWPVTWGLLNDEADDLARLGRFLREYHLRYPNEYVERIVEEAGETIPERARVDEDGLLGSAVRIMIRIQRELARLRQLPVEDDPKPWLRWELAKARWIAIDALSYTSCDNEYVKRVQAEAAAPSPPLALCVGKGYRPVEFDGRRVSFTPQGCYTVFEDALFGRGDMWPHWCPDHQASKPGRDQERALIREGRARQRQKVEWGWTR